MVEMYLSKFIYLNILVHDWEKNMERIMYKLTCYTVQKILFLNSYSKFSQVKIT